MRKYLGLAGLCLGLVLMAPSVAQSQDLNWWSCTWKGTWGEKGNAATAPITLTGYMFAADGGWVIRANSQDSYGPSRIRAGCGEGDCYMDQKYTSGDLKDKVYHFALKSKDGPFKNGVKTITYQGTWGETEEPAEHPGTMAFTGTCKPVPGANDENFGALMKKSLGWDPYGGE
jgi:hypothetical protein